VQADRQHPVDDLCVVVLAAGLQEGRHRIAGAREDRIQHHFGRQRGIDVTVGLRLHDPGAEPLADLQQQFEVGLVRHQLGSQRRILRWQCRHVPGDLHLQRPARHGLESLQGRGVGARRLLLGHRERALQQPHHGGSSQGFLGREVLVQAGLGDADVGGHLVDRHEVESLVGEQPVDRLDDGVLADAQHLFAEGETSHAAILAAAVTM